MGRPVRHIPVKLAVGLISRKPSQFTAATRILEKKFGKIDRETDLLDFSCTRYYQKEFGQNLKRKFLSFKNLIALKQDFGIKLYTNKIERRLSENSRRTINIDPGYVSLAKLILFTTKNRSHRIYADEGIYKDLELVFAKGTFRPLEWTYPDYRTKKYIAFFNSVRELYLSQVRRYL